MHHYVNQEFEKALCGLRVQWLAIWWRGSDWWLALHHLFNQFLNFNVLFQIELLCLLVHYHLLLFTLDSWRLFHNLLYLYLGWDLLSYLRRRRRVDSVSFSPRWLGLLSNEFLILLLQKLNLLLLLNLLSFHFVLSPLILGFKGFLHSFPNFIGSCRFNLYDFDGLNLFLWR